MPMGLSAGLHAAVSQHDAAGHAGVLHAAAGAAAGYTGPPELTPARALTEWMLDPWALIVILALTAAYLAGVRRVRRSGQSWPAGRVIASCGLGSGFAIIATMSFLRLYQPVLFYAR